MKRKNTKYKKKWDSAPSMGGVENNQNPIPIQSAERACGPDNHHSKNLKKTTNPSGDGT